MVINSKSNPACCEKVLEDKGAGALAGNCHGSHGSRSKSSAKSDIQHFSELTIDVKAANSENSPSAVSRAATDKLTHSGLTKHGLHSVSPTLKSRRSQGDMLSGSHPLPRMGCKSETKIIEDTRDLDADSSAMVGNCTVQDDVLIIHVDDPWQRQLQRLAISPRGKEGRSHSQNRSSNTSPIKRHSSNDLVIVPRSKSDSFKVQHHSESEAFLCLENDPRPGQSSSPVSMRTACRSPQRTGNDGNANRQDPLTIAGWQHKQSPLPSLHWALPNAGRDINSA